MVSTSDLLGAVHVLTALASPRAARAAALSIPEHLDLADLLRAADGVQALAMAVAESRLPADPLPEHDPHDVRSLYT